MNTKNLLTFVAMTVLVGAIVSMTTSGALAQSNSNQNDDPYNGSLIDRIMAQQVSSGGNNNGNNNYAGDKEDCVEEEDEEGEEEDADEAEDEDEEGDVDEADDKECGAEDDEDEGEKLFTTSFMTENCTFTSTGRTIFSILEPGYQLVLAGEEDGEVELVITVLNETRVVDGIETRVVEERETVDGELVEVSRNFFAICEETSNVFYFGEEVDDYEDGEIVSHDGEWLAGEDNATAGIIMPGTVLLGARYFQEVAPGVAMDRAEIMEDDEELETPAGTFENVVVIRETTPLEPDAIEFKYHVAGIGLIQDANLKLQEYGFVE